ncbi:MAG: PH domain-containing protein [Dehalococcoidales bacterium]|nr:PH domain-containing protein [Dehalococcoidales bacterium]
MADIYKRVKVPKAIARMLYDDETVIAGIKQSRLRRLFTPDSIFVTNHRIILYAPKALGLRKTIEDYRYRDMANFKADRGILFTTITIKQRFMSNDLVIDSLPKGKADRVARIIHEGIRQLGNGIQPGTVNPAAGIEADNEDPLRVLKLRYARGEISQQQYEEMKRTLE